MNLAFCMGFLLVVGALAGLACLVTRRQSGAETAPEEGGAS